MSSVHFSGGSLTNATREASSSFLSAQLILPFIGTAGDSNGFSLINTEPLIATVVLIQVGSVKYLTSEPTLKRTVYTVERAPRDQVKIDIDQVRGALRTSLLMTAWGDHYYGVDFDKGLESRIFLDGRIEVRGEAEDPCKAKTEEILEVLREALGTISYEDPVTKNVRFEDEIRTDIACVVPDEILTIVRERLSHSCDVKDVSFSFRKTKQVDEVTISFERPAYREGSTEVPLRLIVVAPTKEISGQILEDIRNKLETNTK